MMAELLFVAGCLLYLVFLMARFVPALFAAFPSLKGVDGKLQRYILLSILHIIPFALKNFLGVMLSITESRFTLPSSVSQVKAILLCLSCYLVFTVVGAVMLYACCSVCAEALGQPQDKQLPDWMLLLISVLTVVVIDMLLSYSDMMAALLSLAGYVLYILCMEALSMKVLLALLSAVYPSMLNLQDALVFSIVQSIIHIISLELKNFLWIVLSSESHYTLPSSFSSILVCLACYLVCTMIGVLMFFTGTYIFRATEGLHGRSEDFFVRVWMVLNCVTLVVMDMLLSNSDMIMATLLSLAGYLLYFLCMAALSLLVFWALLDDCLSMLFVEDDDLFRSIVQSIGNIISLELKNFLWIVLSSESHYTLPSSFSSILVCLACYLVCTMVGVLMFFTGTYIFRSTVGRRRPSEDLFFCVWMVLTCVTLVVMDILLSNPDMMATVLSLAGYLVYFLCMATLSFLVLQASAAACRSISVFGKDDELFVSILQSIVHIISLALKNFLWVVLRSESHYALPSSFSNILLCLACYLVCAIIGVLMFYTFNLIFCATLGQPKEDLLFFGWMVLTCVTLVGMDMLLSYSDMMATVLSLAGYFVCMMVQSCLVLGIGACAIQITKIWCWWPELIHTSIVALTFLLLNVMWGSPFDKPTCTDDPDMKSALAGYLIYIVSSMVVSFNLFGARLLLKTFVISLTFVLLDMFVKHSSVSDILTALVALSGMIGTTLLALLFLVAMSFVVFVFLQMWVEILHPSAWRNYPVRTIVGIIGLAFMGMKIMMDIQVDGPSIFFNMKGRLLGITEVFITLGLLLMMPPRLSTFIEKHGFTLVSDDFVQQTITRLVTSKIKWMDGEIKLFTGSSAGVS